MLEIFLYGNNNQGFLDLPAGTRLNMETIFELFDTDLAQGEFSLPIEIPVTERNQVLMGFAERLQNFNNEKNYWQCDVLDKGFPELLQAKLTLLDKDVNLAYSWGKFNASISGTRGLFGSSIKGKKLRQLDLGGIITWEAMESRDFATQVMKGALPQYGHIAFAPVVYENFFDQGKNYNGEFLVKDMANNIVGDSTGGDDNWSFARPTTADPDVITNPGQEEHVDYRTIPYLNFKYVLIAAFKQSGFNPIGDFMNMPGLEKLYIFNNCALEQYSIAVYADYTRRINPADHLPDIELVAFLKAVFDFYNIHPVFDGMGNIDLRFRQKVFQDKRILDITDRCSPSFQAVYKDSSENTGYKLQYDWDGQDSMPGDRVKELNAKTLVATVATRPNLDTLDIGRPFTTDDMVLVEAENMYYIVANAGTIPVLWDAWAERLHDFSVDGEARNVSTGISTLCTYVKFNEDDALFENQNCLACRQLGTYYTNQFARVTNSFALRLFYISSQLVNGLQVPVSHNHNTAPDGSQLVPYSLALQGSAGMAQNFHTLWQAVQERQQNVKITCTADAKLMQELKRCNCISIQNIQFLPYKKENSIPLGNNIVLELMPL